jgi:hypothetical protein
VIFYALRRTQLARAWNARDAATPGQ